MKLIFSIWVKCFCILKLLVNQHYRLCNNVWRQGITRARWYSSGHLCRSVQLSLAWGTFVISVAGDLFTGHPSLVCRTFGMTYPCTRRQKMDTVCKYRLIGNEVYCGCPLILITGALLWPLVLLTDTWPCVVSCWSSDVYPPATSIFSIVTFPCASWT